MYELKKIYHTTEDEASKSLFIMRETALNLGFVHVAEYYSIGSLDAHYGIDGYQYGWTSDILDTAFITRDYKFGWYIKLPDPIKLTSDSQPQTEPTLPDPDILNITIHTNELENPAETLADIFKHIPEIKERMINITIM